MTLSGCATMVHGTTQAIPIVSSPAGARVLIDSVPVGTTPLLATVSRKQSHIVAIVHDSFPPVRVAMDRNVSPWLLGSFFLYFAPAIVDFSTGAAYGFPTDTLRVDLAAQVGGRAAGADVHQTARIPTGSVVTATTASVFLGFGLGPKMVGGRAMPYALTQVGGGALMITGLGMAYGSSNHDDAAAALFFTGFGTIVASRVWEIGDIFDRSSKTNRPSLANAPSSAGRYIGLTFVPVLETRAKGVALRYKF
jgi:hypothetical protein